MRLRSKKIGGLEWQTCDDRRGHQLDAQASGRLQTSQTATVLTSLRRRTDSGLTRRKLVWRPHRIR